MRLGDKMNDNYYFKTEDSELVEFNGQVVCTFETDDNVKYLAYTYNKRDEKGQVIVHGAIISKNNILSPISNDELYLIEDSINLLKDKYIVRDEGNE